jgi:membrane-associated PAP2 superfamily phosphatase
VRWLTIHDLRAAWQRLPERVLLGLLGVTLLWDVMGLDLQLSGLFGSELGFAARDQWFWSVWGHDRLGLLFRLALLALLGWALCGWPIRLAVRQRWLLTINVVLALLLIGVLKRSSLVSCPWDLAVFGGTADWISHWRVGVSDGGPGRCFPAGHASGALGFIGLAWPLLDHTEALRRRQGGWLLTGVLAAGALASVVQLVRGAHPLSHFFWTALICAALTLLIHRLFWRAS